MYISVVSNNLETVSTFQYTQTFWMFQIWDRRHGDHPVKQVPIHSGPVYFCDWHPDNEHWILSAGRDKMIKVRERTHTLV